MKTILVPFADEETGRAGFDAAAALACRFCSHVEGLFVHEGPPLDLGPGIAVPAEYLEHSARAWRRLADGRRAAFRARADELGLRNGELESPLEGPTACWRELEGREAQLVAEHGRLFDLIVLGRPFEAGGGRFRDTCEAALFDSGRPVLLVPPDAPTAAGGTAVIAWNGSTENARTVALGLPLLAAADRVVVLTIAEGMLPGPAGAELATHLARQGFEVTARTVQAGSRSLGEATLAEAAAMGANLLVKGAYARSRLRQVVFGGATTHVLEHARLPVLMAH